MKTSIDWLKDFIAIDMPAEQLAEELTLAGLEVDSVTAAGGAFAGVVVAEILAKRAHPDADRLAICRITDGSNEHEVVCGAPNAALGLKVPFAPVGTSLPGGLKIKTAKIRGVTSSGMLCSAKELGLADDAAGLLVLDPEAAVGDDLRQYLSLDDHVLDIDLTPNRGDCFSILGIAREVAARHSEQPLEESVDCIEPATDRTFDVELLDSAACPRFAGRVISGLDTAARTPVWLRERLRRAGLRPIHPVVDVTNYVMLELGQPLHAYRLDKLKGPIEVRFARDGESLTLLDQTKLTLDSETLVIADQSGAIGLAGIMGGLSTAVDAATDEIFLESAFFSPSALQGRARRYNLHTDASVRFERGVDPSGQERAIERASSLLAEIAGGKPGPLLLAEDEAALPQRKPILLREQRVESVLGIAVSAAEIGRLLERLGMLVELTPGGFEVTAPTYRFDIAIEEDLIEELGRMIGYDQIPAHPASATVRLGQAPERKVSVDTLSDLLVARGYYEIVSYGFTEAAAQARVTGTDAAVRLANPISQDLNVLRSSLWPGLLRAARLNQSYQLERCRLFEAGTVFAAKDHAVTESQQVAGLITGARTPTYWDGKNPVADFFDLKGDLQALLANWRSDIDFQFHAATQAAMNPSRSAKICQGNETVGWLGELHPRLLTEYDFRQPVQLFAIDLTLMSAAALPKFAEYSKYPSVRRDLALVVDESVHAADLTKLVAEVLGKSLKRHEIFDVYRGKGVDTGRKSIGIGLILQGASRTLTDEETDAMIQQVVRRLEHELGATIRN